MATFLAVVSGIVMVAVVAFLIWSLLTSIRDERRREGIRKVWANFGLSISLLVLFFVSWATQALAQWEVYRSDQELQGEPAPVDGFVVEFAHSTLENWQSEFLQLFSFVVLAALYIHRGSGESKDGQDRMEAMLRDIKRKLDA